jgi:ribonuclease G
VSKRIVVNVGLLETRVAVQERNLLTELYLERHRHRSIVGSVYKGTVTNVLPGMQAAFVDIGLSKDAFLYAGDYTANLTDAGHAMLSGAEDDADPDADSEEGEEPKREATGPIEEMLSRNQEVLVQVSKESLGTKGAGSRPSSRFPGATWSTCRRPDTSGSRAASRMSASGTACGRPCAVSSCRPAASS